MNNILFISNIELNIKDVFTSTGLAVIDDFLGPKIPPAASVAVWQRYDAMIDRVRAVGFNSSGAFGGVSDGARKKSWPWTPMFPLGTWNLGHQIPGVRGVFDPFDAEVPAKIAELSPA